MAIACSAVVIIFPKGVFITITPFFEAALRSILSTPIPARPITFKFVAALSNFSVTFVADLIANPSYSLIFAKSASLSLPNVGKKSTEMLLSRKI